MSTDDDTEVGESDDVIRFTGQTESDLFSDSEAEKAFGRLLLATSRGTLPYLSRDESEPPPINLEFMGGTASAQTVVMEDGVATFLIGYDRSDGPSHLHSWWRSTVELRLEEEAEDEEQDEEEETEEKEVVIHYLTIKWAMLVEANPLTFRATEATALIDGVYYHVDDLQWSWGEKRREEEEEEPEED